MEIVESQKKVYIKTEDGKFFNLITQKLEENVYLRKPTKYKINKEISEWIEKNFDKYINLDFKKGE
ncbi:hypothetical protein HOG47_07655 [archaeon]|jgi:hypothetical protein|nr:hypothetical protein [archaeon]